MVLRGAQFQRSGPAGYRFLTRQALSLYRATFVQEHADAVCLQQGNQITRRHRMPFHGGAQCWQPHEGLASHGASG